MADVAAANKTLKLFAMYCGTDDTLVYPGTKALSSALLAKGVNVKYTETNGWALVHRVASKPAGLRATVVPVTRD